jgi:hypothetical protein
MEARTWHLNEVNYGTCANCGYFLATHADIYRPDVGQPEYAIEFPTRRQLVLYTAQRGEPEPTCDWCCLTPIPALVPESHGYTRVFVFECSVHRQIAWLRVL